MVLSASSVYSYEVNDGDSYAVVRRQLVWVLIGLPLAWFASRLPHRWIRRLAYPGFSVSLVLLLLTAFFGVERNGNQNWLGVGPLVIQPSEIAKLAMVIWAAHIYANKERRLDSTHEIIVPVVPGMMLATGLVVLGNDLGTALVLFALLLGSLWVVGRAPPVLRGDVLGRPGRADRAGQHQRRAARTGSPTSSTPSTTTTTRAGSRPTASTPSPPAGCSARASVRASRSGATCPRPTPTSSSPCSARSSASRARCWS